MSINSVTKDLRHTILSNSKDINIKTINGIVKKSFKTIQITLCNPKYQFEVDIPVHIIDHISTLPPVSTNLRIKLCL